MRTKTVEDYENYKTIRNTVNAKIRTIKEQYWEAYTSNLERDFYGIQPQIWRTIRNQRLEVKDFVISNKTEEST